MTAIALAIAGSDPSGGAGIQADLKTFSALGAYGAAVITALTAQNTQGVQGVMAVPAEFIGRQIDSIFADMQVGAVKIGMLPSVEAIDAVAEALVRHTVKTLILDPVMVATSGDRLIPSEAVRRLRDTLLPLALVVTPNLPETAALLGEANASDEAGLADQATRLLALGPGAVLAKGGHLAGPSSTDILAERGGSVRFEAPRHPTRNTHGTGCTLSSAIAALMARGLPLHDAVREAKRYLSGAIAAADELAIGRGAGPVHHFHAWWRGVETRRS